MKNQVVLITGCSSGVGKALCAELKRRGCIVIASARRPETLDDLDADMKLRLDVTDEAQIGSAISEIIARFERIDILINNAGYSVRAAVEELDIDAAKKMFDVNVFGILRMTKAVAPYMREQRSGRIINIGSVSGKLTGRVNGGYCASKHAVEAITEAARYELKDFGVQVTVFEPGAMDTDFFETLSRNSDGKMKNESSPYSEYYRRDLSYRAGQKKADVSKAARQMCDIIAKPRLRARYKIALPLMFSVLLRLPDGLREALMLRFN